MAKYCDKLLEAAETILGDILVLIGRSTETGRKIGSGGMRLGRNVEETLRLRIVLKMDNRSKM